MGKISSGRIALFGGGAFRTNDEIDAGLIGEHIRRIAVLPTADAFEQPALLVSAAGEWAARLGVDVTAVMALTRPDASRDEHVSAIDAADAVWLVGDSPIHLRTVLKETNLLEAVIRVGQRGGLIAAVGGSAAALCDPMTDPRGGAFTIGLGLVSGVAVLTEVESWTTERLDRARHLAGAATLVELPTGTAVVYEPGSVHSWTTFGEVVVQGSLPD